MIGWIVNASLRFGRLVAAAAVALLVVGIVQIRDAPRDALPEFGPPMVEVQTEALGLSAAEVEQLITVPLEQDLLVGVAFLKDIESVSLPGLSAVVMTFEPGTDMLEARQVVQERLTQAVGIAGLPAVAKPPQMLQPLSSQSRVAMIKLSSDSLSAIDMSVLSRWVIGPRLMGVPGVANVAIWGNRERQLQVLVDPERLRDNGATLAQVIRTAGNSLEVSELSFLEASKPGTGGFIDTPNQRLNIFHEQVITSADELAQVPLEGTSGAPVPLGALTDVVENHQPLIGDAICSGGEPCLLLVVEKFPGAETGAVTEGVEAALDALQPGLEGLEMDPSVYRPASYVESSFSTAGAALALGGILLLLVIGLSFWSWRRALVTAAAIVLSAATALAVLSLREVTLTFMVAAGLVLGLTVVIHEAVTDTHVTVRRMRRADAGTAPARRDVVREAARELRSAALYAALVIAAASVPLFFLGGEGGPFLPSLAASYLLAIAASMLVALVVTPVLAVALLRPEASRTPPAAGVVERGYRRLSARLSSLPRAVAASTLLAVVGLLTVPFLDLSLRPDLKERELLVHVAAEPGTSLPSMTQQVSTVVRDLEALPGVAQANGQVGRAIMSDETVDVSSGEIWVSIDPAVDYDDTVAAVERTVAERPGLTTELTTYSQERVTEVMGASGSDVVVRVYGEDAAVRDAKAEELLALVAGVPGAQNAQVQRAPQESTMQVTVDLARAQAHGIKPGDVRRAAATLLGGMTVGHLFDEQKVFDVVVWSGPQVRENVADVEQLLIDTPGGGHVRLAEVADLQVLPTPSVIRHESVASYLDVTADVTGRGVEDVVEEVDDAVGAVAFPLDHHAEVLGGLDEQDAVGERLIAVTLASLIAVFLLLQAAFRSWRLAGLGILLLPLATVGGLVAVVLTERTVTIGVVGGLLAVLGIAARQIVLMLRRYQHLEHVERVPFGPELVARGTREVAVPALIAVLATVAALAPLAALGARPGLEVLHPAVVVVLGGIVTSALVTLFILPPLYVRWGHDADAEAWVDELLGPVPAPRTSPIQPRVRPGAVQRVRRQVLPLALALPGLLTASCGGTVADAYVIEHEPGHVETVAGFDRTRVVLEEQAVERLAIRTTPVQTSEGALVVPRSAVFVETDGTWWVYTSQGHAVYERHEIAVEREDGELAVLSSGPPVGTHVVTVGVAEIAGVEDGVGH